MYSRVQDENTMVESAPRLDPQAHTEHAQWCALQTRPRHEKKVAAELQEKGIETYLPLVTEIHRWSDRRKSVQVPLFSCYAFVHSRLEEHLYTCVSRIWGALGFVGPNHQATSIPEEQIETVRMLLANNAEMTRYPFVKAGQRVRVKGGSLDGIEGILLSDGKQRLVISVETINHSLSVDIEGQNIEPV